MQAFQVTLEKLKSDSKDPSTRERYKRKDQDLRPHCCRGTYLPLEPVAHKLSDDFKKHWNYFIREHAAQTSGKKQTFCPNLPACGVWIPESCFERVASTRVRGGRITGRCPACNTKVAHPSATHAGRTYPPPAAGFTATPARVKPSRKLASDFCSA